MLAIIMALTEASADSAGPPPDKPSGANGALNIRRDKKNGEKDAPLSPFRQRKRSL
jgi:hypothetical protein